MNNQPQGAMATITERMHNLNATLNNIETTARRLRSVLFGDPIAPFVFQSSTTSMSVGGFDGATKATTPNVHDLLISATEKAIEIEKMLDSVNGRID